MSLFDKIFKQYHEQILDDEDGNKSLIGLINKEEHVDDLEKFFSIIHRKIIDHPRFKEFINNSKGFTNDDYKFPPSESSRTFWYARQGNLGGKTRFNFDYLRFKGVSNNILIKDTRIRNRDDLLIDIRPNHRKYNGSEVEDIDILYFIILNHAFNHPRLTPDELENIQEKKHEYT